MHLDLYIKAHKDDCPRVPGLWAHCTRCCIRCLLGSESWSSMCIIGSNKASISDIYVNGTILSCLNEPSVPLQLPAGLFIVPHQTSPGILLDCLPTRMLFLANDTSTKFFRISRPISGWMLFPYGIIIENLWALDLSLLSSEQIMQFRETVFPNL